MPTRRNNANLYLATMADLTTDPSADGSGYSQIHAMDLGFADPGKEVLETAYWTGSGTTTTALRGNDATEITFGVPVIGMASVAGDGTAASSVANDWLDFILNSALGTLASTSGEGVGVGSTTSNLVTDADTYGEQDLVAVTDAAINSGYAQVRRLGATTSPYTVHRNWGTAPTATAVAYGAKIWRGPVNADNTNYLAGLLQLDGSIYMMLGGRPNSLTLTMAAGQQAKFNVGIQFDSRTEDSSNKTAPDTFTSFVGTPIIGQLGSVAWGSSEYAVGEVTIDFGLSTSPIAAVGGANGRAGIQVMEAHPTVTITPAFATSWETDFLAGTTRTLEIKIGSGALSGSALNCLSFFAEVAEVIAVPGQDDNNQLRQGVQFAIRDAGEFVTGTSGHYFQLARF